jgi:hypothetical protein
MSLGILYIKVTCLFVCMSVCPGSFQALPGPAHTFFFFFLWVLFFVSVKLTGPFFFFWWVLFFVSVKLAGPFFFFFWWVLFFVSVKLFGPYFFFFFDGFYFLCQLNCPDLCFFFFWWVLFSVSIKLPRPLFYFWWVLSTRGGALCTKFTLVTLMDFALIF